MDSALRKMVSQAKAKYAGNAGKAIKPNEGRNTYRILAPKNVSWTGPNGEFWADLGVHWIKAEENAKPAVVIGDCDTVYQQPSVINTAIEMAINSAMDEESKKLYESWKARKSVLLNVIDRSSGSEEILELTPSTWGKVLELIALHLDFGQDITDPENGVDIIITRTGKGLNTNYDVAVAPGKSQPVTPEQLARAKDLQEFIRSNYFRGEEQKALNAIQQFAGISVPRLAGPANAGALAAPAAATLARTPTAALASPNVAVADAAVDVEVPTTAAPAATVSAEEQAAMNEAARRREEILRRQQEAARELEELERQAAATAQPAAVVAPASSNVSADDADAILKELEGLG